MNLLVKNIPLFGLELLVLLVGEVPEHVVADDEDAPLPEPGIQLVRPAPVVLLPRHSVHVHLQVACTSSTHQSN